MDPQACLHLAAEALSEGDLETAKEHLDAYSAWVAKGGFRLDSAFKAVSDAYFAALGV